jgi:hypothetical protein
MKSSRAVRVLACFTLFSIAGSAALAQIGGDPNACDIAGEVPDVILGSIYGTNRYGEVGGITGFSFATESCNIGTCEAIWQSGSPGNHPVIAQHMYRLMDGRFTQIGQSWVNHGFSTLNGDLCATGEDPCFHTGGQTLGVNCSDPYSANLNGGQNSLGPKSEVFAYPGTHLHPYTDQGSTGNAIYKRLQVHNVDLDPALNAGATYILEGQYVTEDDAAAGNNNNNSAYRRINITGTTSFNIQLTGSTAQQTEAMRYWEIQDPTIFLKTIDVPDDGYMLLGSQVYDLGGGFWRYEYALQNVTSDRSAGSFTVPIPDTAVILNAGFHDVDYHSGEPWDGTDWTITVGPDSVRWETVPFASDPDANALRWGTTYNFYFDADVEPSVSTVTVGLFAPGTPTEIVTGAVLPDPNGSGGGIPAGEVLDGLVLAKGLLSQLDLEWDSSCVVGDADYEVYEGMLGDYTSHDQRECTTGGATSASLLPAGGDTFYLIVPRTESVEGSYGRASDGTPRDASLSACAPTFAEVCE